MLKFRRYSSAPPLSLFFSPVSIGRPASAHEYPISEALDSSKNPTVLCSMRSSFMGLRVLRNLNLLVLVSLFALQARAEGSRSVLFLDGSDQRYIRSHPVEIAGEVKPLSTREVAAIISVLLGFSPPASLPVDSSVKLNEVLFPNPFDRPRAVLMLEVEGVEGQVLSIADSDNKVGSAVSRRVLGSSKADIQLPDEDEVSVLPLDEPLGVECDASCVDKELDELARWLGGTYVRTVASQDGELNFPLASGSSLRLHIAKKPDRHFAVSLVSLIKNIKKSVEIHEDFAESSVNPAELLIGRFTGIQALREEYGTEGDIVNQALDLVETTLIKSFEFLQKSYGGKIVGVVLSTSEPYSAEGAMLDVKFSTRESRLLEEVIPANVTAIAEMLLVRRSLAWITGVILLISTLIGVYFLLNMPLTRDTLLYSNVKLD